MRPHRRRHMLCCGSDAPSNVANRPDGRPERSGTCDPSTAIFIHLRVALAGRCHDQLRPDLLETPGYGKRCSIGYVSACNTRIPAVSSLKPSTYTHQLRVGDAASRPSRGGLSGHERWHPVRWSLLVSCVPVGRASSCLPQEPLWGCQRPGIW